MPTYDYQCRSCGTRIEVIHAMTDPGPEICETCGGELRRVLYPTGIIFKGSGFYRTDSRNPGGSSDGKDASGTDAPATSTDGSGSGSGPEKGSSSPPTSSDSAPKKAADSTST